MYYDYLESSIGKIYVVVDAIGVCRVELFEDEWNKYIENNPLKRDIDACSDVIKQLKEYFKGERKTFDLPLHIEGTDFQKAVWTALSKIPYGKVYSYLDIAQKINRPKAVRAIGQANRRNQHPIIIPCHRVIGKNGQLIGFAGNRIDVKKQLLEHEGIII